jgi:hypothetical protein
MTVIRYNEKSWKIDVISEINLYLNNLNISIKRAGGEKTISSGTSQLFPDVLLFGDEYSGLILQGWELKFPDTSIIDNELLKNAQKKANLLGLNSFLIWNVSIAVLYIKDNNEIYNPVKTWNNLSHINSRALVEQSKNEWILLLKEILNYLNSYFEKGILRCQTIISSFSEEGVIDLILRNSNSLSNFLNLKSSEDASFDAEVDKWWRSLKSEYTNNENKFDILAKLILITWMNKFIFAHVIKIFYSVALKVETIDEKVNINDAITIFKFISEKCDFLNIFKPQLGEKYITNETWNEIIQLNQFLVDFHLEKINQHLLHKLLQAAVNVTKRKTAGQFITPYVLAQLLVRLTADDKNKKIFDPCCGTGTIAKAAYDIKVEYGISNDTAISDIWASDKFSYPVQVTTLSLAYAENINKIIQVFQKDVTALNVREKVIFCDPNNGNNIEKELPLMDYIVSNLPFVQQEDIDISNPGIDLINKRIKEITQSDLMIPARSDLFVYIPFYLWDLLEENGKIGIIISNAWLGTDYGKVFRNLLQKFFNIEYIIISGKGRWFRETKVVTSIVVLKKISMNVENNSDLLDKEISFVTLKNSLQDIENKTKDVSTDILTYDNSDLVSIQRYKINEIKLFEDFGLEWSAFFTNLDWFSNMKDKLIKANTIFNINRGERRGWDKLFYPQDGHNIEQEYIKTVLKSPSNIEGFIADPEAEAFCCSKDINELESLGHMGALTWIRKFENQVNDVGIPLKKSLARSGMYWYEMNDKTTAELVANINYDERLFISKLSEPSFVNQRLTRFTLIDKKGADIDLYHALLNSIIGLFYLEALGFGRGLGALDLSSTKLSNQLFMLNPFLLEKNHIKNIKVKFSKLKKRKIYPITEEIYNSDRIDFDMTVLESYGITNLRQKIIDSLLNLYNIRKAVNK